MHVSRCLHIGQDIILKLLYRLQRIRHVLILLDVADDLGRLCALGEIDEGRLLDDGGYTILNEGEIGEVDAWRC
jgi:hypothetical protein